MSSKVLVKAEGYVYVYEQSLWLWLDLFSSKLTSKKV